MLRTTFPVYYNNDEYMKQCRWFVVPEVALILFAAGSEDMVSGFSNKANFEFDVKSLFIIYLKKKSSQQCLLPQIPYFQSKFTLPPKLSQLYPHG